MEETRSNSRRILTEPETFPLDSIKKIEAYYGAVYVCESAIVGSMGWTDFAIAIFWQPEPHPDGSNWFGIYDRGNGMMICDAITAVQKPFDAYEAANGDIIYSRSRHDFRASPDGTVTVDGGRDYGRMLWDGDSFDGGMPKVLKLKIIGPVMTIMDDSDGV